MKYEIRFYKSSARNELINYILTLDTRSRVKINKDLALLREYGLQLINTKWVKKINRDPDLFELRTKSGVEIRSLFYFVKLKTINIVNIFIKKSQKSPKNEIEIALKRISV